VPNNMAARELSPIDIFVSLPVKNSIPPVRNQNI
jgi:hypothetical protein